MAGWWVYIARCSDGSLYTGVSNDVARRIAAHNAGKGAAYTRARRPVALVYCEPAPGRGAALRREAAIKRWTRKEKLAAIAAWSAPRGSAASEGVALRPRRTGRAGRRPLPPRRSREPSAASPPPSGVRLQVTPMAAGPTAQARRRRAPFSASG